MVMAADRMDAGALARVEAITHSGPSELPRLLIRASNLPQSARELRELLATTGLLFERGPVPVRLAVDNHPRGPMNQRSTRFSRLDFATVNTAALRALPDLLARWLPDGRAQGVEWVARNPRRDDRSPGSFKVNLRTGRWADFATGDRGGDPVSLAAYLHGLRPIEAGRRLAAMLGLPGGETRRG